MKYRSVIDKAIFLRFPSTLFAPATNRKPFFLIVQIQAIAEDFSNVLLGIPEEHSRQSPLLPAFLRQQMHQHPIQLLSEGNYQLPLNELESLMLEKQVVTRVRMRSAR